MKAYYFSENTCKLRYGDGREIKQGITHTVEGTPKLCEHGLHASKHPFDALQYAPGEMLWLVELGGEMDRGGNKIAAQSRTYIAGFDATELLRECARKYARDVLHLWDAPQVVVDYLNTGDERLRADALDAARYAARDSRSAHAAAWDAAWYAAWYAAHAAAWDAAWYAAWDAARKNQRAYFARQVNNEFRKMGVL